MNFLKSTLFFCISLLITACNGINVVVENGSGSGTYASKGVVKITAYLPNPGYEFDRWEGDLQYVKDVNKSETLIQLPELGKDETLEVKVKATYAIDPNAAEYELSIENGEGSGHYLTYTIVSISAEKPDEGYVFNKWTGDVQYLNNPYLPNQKLVIKKENIHLVATYTQIVVATPTPNPTPTPTPTPAQAGLPSLVNHNATFLWGGNKIWMMSLLSPKASRSDFQKYVLQMKNGGANFTYLLLANEDTNDPWAPFTLYKNNKIGQDVDPVVVAEMQWRLQFIRNQGMGVILWIRTDDCKTFNLTPVEQQLRYQEDVVEFFDSFTSGYVTALEADEYMNAEATNFYAGHLRQLTSKEIGVHLTGGNISHCLQPNIQACYYQYGFNKTASYVESDTRDKIAKLKGKPFYAAEYHLDASSAAAKELGDAAMRGGAKGTGCNRNTPSPIFPTPTNTPIAIPTSAPTIDPTSVPTPNPTHTPEIEYVSGEPKDFNLNTTIFLHSNISNWPVTSNLSSVKVDKLFITYNHTKSNDWKSDGEFNANPWIIVKHSGKWYACTNEWLKVGQIKKMRDSINGAHCKQQPLVPWIPTPGEKIGFMVSGLARFGTPGSHERTNIKWLKWPENDMPAESDK